jgi:hypothetical protein
MSTQDDELTLALNTALADWSTGRAYIDGNGNYHVVREGRKSGPIAPWNLAVKRRFSSVDDFHTAAKLATTKVLKQ